MDNIKIKSLSIHNFCCFKDATLDLYTTSNSPYQWTVLMGNNNTGKTSLLKAIAELTPTKLNRPNSSNIKELVPAAFYDASFMRSLNSGATISATLNNDMNWRYSKNVISVVSETKFPLDKQLLIFGYGVSRYPSSTSLSDNKAKPCDTLFSTDTRLVNLEEWLMQLDYAAKNDKSVAETRLNRIKDLICGNLFPEICNFKFESSDELHNYVLFSTKDGDFRYTQLGYGYQSMLSWIVDLSKRMFDAYPEMENPLHGEAIVLIDEIDLHLHPKWQRDIISYLSEAFPNIQFIVTTHSPLVVQSVKDINLYVLRRADDGKVHLEKSDRNNYSGWTVEEILRETMNLESDIHSDIYNQTISKFYKGLDLSDKEMVNEAYSKLDKMLHPSNPMRRLFELQKDSME